MIKQKKIESKKCKLVGGSVVRYTHSRIQILRESILQIRNAHNFNANLLSPEIAKSPEKKETITSYNIIIIIIIL